MLPWHLSLHIFNFLVSSLLVALFYVCLILFPTWDSHIVFLYVAAVWAWGGFAVPTGWFAPHFLDTSIAWCTRETDRCGQASGSRGQVAPHESTEQSWLNKVPARDEWHWNSKYTHLCYRLAYFINILWLNLILIEFNNCPTRCNLFSLLYFCRQLYMFRGLTPIIRSSYNFNYSFCYWLTGSTTIRSRCWVLIQFQLNNESRW